jgi:hypothetical protein
MITGPPTHYHAHQTTIDALSATRLAIWVAATRQDKDHTVKQKHGQNKHASMLIQAAAA